MKKYRTIATLSSLFSLAISVSVPAEEKAAVDLTGLEKQISVGMQKKPKDARMFVRRITKEPNKPANSTADNPETRKNTTLFRFAVRPE